MTSVWVVGQELAARYLQEPAGADDCADISAFLSPPSSDSETSRSSDQPNNQQEDMWYLPCGPGWREGGGGGRMGEGLLQRDASSALVTRQLCNSAEAEVGEAVRSPLFTHQPISPQMPNTQTLRDPTFSGELLLVQHLVHCST